MFNCEYNGNYVETDTLPFDVIKNQCQNIRLANQFNPSKCNSLDDLVYRNDTCECPYCKCSTKSARLEEEVSYNGNLYQSDSGPYAACYNCTCQEPLWYWDGITDLIYSCGNALISVHLNGKIIHVHHRNVFKSL